MQSYFLIRNREEKVFKWIDDHPRVGVDHVEFREVLVDPLGLHIGNVDHVLGVLTPNVGVIRELDDKPVN
ncbi:hypothetical protein D3C78_1638680 [compost metagenome]